MRVFSSWPFTGSASLLTTAVLLWLGAFLSWWPAGGSEVYAASPMAGAPHAEQAANGYRHSLDGDYLAVFAAEGEAGEKLPRNAALLRTLVLALFFGPLLGWIVVSRWMRSRPEVCSPNRCCFCSVVHLYQRRAVAALLEVFRL